MAALIWVEQALALPLAPPQRPSSFPLAPASSLGTNGLILSAWGRSDLGQTTPPASLTNVVRVVGGFGHSVALTTAGQVVAWGDNRFGQLQVPVGLSGVVQIASGYAHTVALKDDGTVVGWGANYGTVYSI